MHTNKMDDQDAWMTKYINKKRMLFLNKLNTRLFVEGFPGIHSHQRSKTLCCLNNEGEFAANSYLLDYITKIDGFPRLFIDFCQNNDCNGVLMHYIEEGLKKYNRLRGNVLGSQASHDSFRRQRSRHHQRSHPSAPPEEVDQSSKKSGEITEHLLKQLTYISVCDINESEGATEHREVSDIAETDVIIERDFVNGCIITDLVGARGDAWQDSSDTQGVLCPCPHHANVESKGDNHRNEAQESCNKNEIEASCSLSDTQNMHSTNLSSYSKQSNIKNYSPFCDPNNMDINDPFKKMSVYNDKMEMNAEKTTNGVKKNLTKDTKKDENVANNKTNIDHLMKTGRTENVCGSNEIQSSNQRVSHQYHNEAFFDSTESVGSYYLTSSDEEECLPAHNYGICEIEPLKLPASSFPSKEGPMQESNTAETSFGHLLVTMPKEIESSRPSEDSKANFIMINTNLSGIQCQEDTEKYKIETHTTERIEHSAVSDVSKIQGGTRLLVSLVSKNLLESDSSDSEMLDKSTYKSSQIFNHGNTLIKLGITNNQEPVELGNRNTVISFNEGPTSVESFMSETELKQVEEMVNETFETVQQTSDGNQIQCKPDDYFSVALNVTNTSVKKTVEIEKKSVEVNRSRSVPLLLSNSSEGFEVHIDLSRSSQLEITDSDSINVRESHSGHDLKACLSSLRSETNHSNFSTNEAVNSLATDELDGEADVSVMKEYSDVQPQTNTTDHIGTDNSFLLTVSYQLDSTEHSINLLEPNQERAANGYIEETINSRNLVALNAIQYIRPMASHFYTFIRDNSRYIYLPEFDIRF